MHVRTLRCVVLVCAVFLAACAEKRDIAGPAPDPVASVTVSPDTITLRAGYALALSATVRSASGATLPEYPLDWSSSDSATVSVVDGLVRARAPGTALIIASAGEGQADTATVMVREVVARDTALPPEPALPAEARALWVNRFEYRSAAEIAEIMDKASRAGFNLVYFQVRGAADAMYRSDIEPCAVSLCGRLGGTPSYDPLEVAVREAHARGLQLHAWLNALVGWGSGSAGVCSALRESDPGNPRHILLQHPEWAMRDRAGRAHPCPNRDEYVYLSPGNAGVRTRLARVAADIMRRYAVDGIHLDRIRYPGTGWSYDPASLAAFGGDPAADPAGWARFRRELVGRMVRETRDSIRAVRPSAALSAAVWGIYTDQWGWSSSEGRDQYLQDPREWAREGYLDVAVPMTYYSIHARLCGFADWACLLDDHLRGIQHEAGRHLYIGIEAKRGAEEVLRQIRLGRERGVRGFSIYSYNAVERADLWGTLASAFAEPAVVPELGWLDSVPPRADRSSPSRSGN